MIKGLKTTRGDLDTIPVRLFKSFSHVIVEPLIQVIYSTFWQGVYPNQLKIAHVTLNLKNKVIQLNQPIIDQYPHSAS